MERIGEELGRQCPTHMVALGSGIPPEDRESTGPCEGGRLGWRGLVRPKVLWESLRSQSLNFGGCHFNSFQTTVERNPGLQDEPQGREMAEWGKPSLGGHNQKVSALLRKTSQPNPYFLLFYFFFWKVCPNQNISFKESQFLVRFSHLFPPCSHDNHYPFQSLQDLLNIQ